MFLQYVRLDNFRSFESDQLELQKDLTVLVGENNGGKSNAIDAIRLLTAPLGGRREIYCEVSDIRFQSGANHFEIQGHFAALSAGQQGRLISASADTSLTHACVGVRYDASRTRPELWAGKYGNAPERNCLDMVRHIYLPTLRDAKRWLASGNPTRVMALLSHFLDGTEATELAKELGRSTNHRVLARVDAAVEKCLSALTGGVRRQAASIGFASNEALVDIARDLRFKLADHGITPEDLRYSGHGYANLLFMATIAVELERTRDADLTIFLVEEPEAHLHPQLQAAVLSFLREQAEKSRASPPADQGPAGELQVVVATHSPNLSAWVSSDRLVVVKSVIASVADVTSRPVEPMGLDADKTAHEKSETAKTTRRATRCLPLARMPLKAIDRRKVDRYLDVTKSALLFGGRVLLVEGIAEALLFPVIAKLYVLKDSPEELRVFRSAAFVPIDGVDFDPYVTLLLTEVNGVRIADRVIVVTDGDKELESEHDDELDAEHADAPGQTSVAIEGLGDNPSPGELRKHSLEKMAAHMGASDRFAAITSTYSLESELIEVGNADILGKAYLKLHPRSNMRWRAAIQLSGEERAKAIHALFKRARKGDFAHVLAQLVEDGESFIVPKYIESAIEQLVAT